MFIHTRNGYINAARVARFAEVSDDRGNTQTVLYGDDGHMLGRTYRAPDDVAAELRPAVASGARNVRHRHLLG